MNSVIFFFFFLVKLLNFCQNFLLVFFRDKACKISHFRENFGANYCMRKWSPFTKRTVRYENFFGLFIKNPFFLKSGKNWEEKDKIVKIRFRLL